MHSSVTHHRSSGPITPWLFTLFAFLLTIYAVYALRKPFWESYLQSIVLFNVGVEHFWHALGRVTLPYSMTRQRVKLSSHEIALGLMGMGTLLHHSWVLPIALLGIITHGGYALTYLLLPHRQDPWKTLNRAFYSLFVLISLLISVWER